MEIQDMISSFLNSSHGQGAVDALGANHGIEPAQAQEILGHATTAAAAHVNEHHESKGLFGDHMGRNFFAAFTAGIVKGDGLLGALEDGALGAVTGRITEALVDQMGMDSSAASAIAATATPYIASFLKEKFNS